MATTISTQDLIDVKRDIDDIGKAVNEKVIVSPRYGEDFKSIPMISAEFQISADAAEASALSAARSANTATSAAQNASSSANIAEAAATAATISAGVFETPEAGVDPVTGVADGAYFNVRSSSDESYVDEYQNIGGVATPTGKSYPSSVAVRNIAKHTALPFVAGKTYALHERVQLANGDVVKSTVADNTNDPNLNMVGWIHDQPFKTLYDFGAVGDGVADDSDSIQAAFDYGKIFVTDGQFPITKRIQVQKDLVLIGLGGVLKPNLSGPVIILNSGVRFVGDNLDIDGSLYPFNWDAGVGMYVFGDGGLGPQLFSLTNSRIKNVYGAGVRIRARFVSVKNNILIDVTGNNWNADPSGAYDNYGDGIHVMGCSVGVVEGNYVDNTLIEQSDSYLGRGGIVSEFGANNLTIANNYVAGYDRGIHAESVYDNVIKNNSVEKCGAALLLSAAKNCTIESNTLTANRKFTGGTFTGYGNCYSYGANSGCSFLNNKIKVVGGLGYHGAYVAMLFSGSNSSKDILVEGNIIEGGFSTNGGENFYVQNNTFNADPDLRTVFFNYSVSFLNNTFKEGVQLRAIGIGGKSVIEGNKFYDVASDGVLEVTNPSSSGFTINNNRFYLKLGATNTSVIAASMSGDKIGEMSGNIVIAPHTEKRNINLVQYETSPGQNKIYTLEPNLLINGGGEIQSLKVSSIYGMSRNTLEFFKGGNASDEPKDNIFYQVGSRVYLADSTNANNPAFFIALNSGYAANTAWSSGVSIHSGEIRYNGSNVYRAGAAGTTGGKEPTHTSGTVSDGSISWTYLGAKSLFKPVGMKGAAVSDATGTDDTSVKLNALIASLKNAGLIQ